MSFDLLRRVRSLATLGVLAVLLLGGVTWGWSAVTQPFPESEDPPVCEETVVAAGDKVYPDQVTVSVLNAGTREGLADVTLKKLTDAGFVAGDQGNAPGRAKVTRAEIWTDDPRSAAVRLVATYLSKNGKGVEIRKEESDAIGVNVLVGDDFTTVVKGRKALAARVDTTICSPATD